MVLNMCRVLNMLEFLIFVNFCKYDRVQNMRRDAIMEGFSEYSRFRVCQVSVYASVAQDLNMPDQLFKGF